MLSVLPMAKTVTGRAELIATTGVWEERECNSRRDYMPSLQGGEERAGGHTELRRDEPRKMQRADLGLPKRRYSRTTVSQPLPTDHSREFRHIGAAERSRILRLSRIGTYRRILDAKQEASWSKRGTLHEVLGSIHREPRNPRPVPQWLEETITRAHREVLPR